MKLSLTTENLVRQARISTRASGFLGWTLICLGAVSARQWLAPPLEAGTIFDRHMRRWTRGLLTMFGATLSVGSPLPPPATRARLVVSNHRSPFDIAVLLTYFGGSVLSRSDLARWPVLGTAAKRANTIFVDRDSKTSRSNAVRVIRRHLKRGGTVSVFPEGTTFAGDEVKPFKRGAFAAAKGLDVEIVPAGITYPPGVEFTEKDFVAHLGRIAARPQTRIGFCAGEGRSAWSDAGEMAAWSQQAVQEAVHRARRASE